MNEGYMFTKTMLAMLEQAQTDNRRLKKELAAMTADREKWLRAANAWYENSAKWLRRWRTEREKNAWLQDRYDRLMGWHLGDDNDNENDGDE